MRQNIFCQGVSLVLTQFSKFIRKCRIVYKAVTIQKKLVGSFENKKEPH